MNEINISNMSDAEKEAFIDTIETMIDYGDRCYLTDNDMKLYDALIAERAENDSKEKNTLDDIISSAQSRCDEQEQTDIFPVRNTR